MSPRLLCPGRSALLGSALLALVWLSACGSGRDVHGGLRALRVTDDQRVFFPLDLRSDRFVAYVERGDVFDTVAGLGYADGVFIITEVPEGDYLLRHDTSQSVSFFATDADDIDLSAVSLGRTDLLVPAEPSALELHISGLSTWEARDRLQLVSANQGVVIDDLAALSSGAPAPGAERLERLTLEFSARALPLLDESRGDRFLVTQLEVEGDGALERLVLSRAFEAAPVSMVEGVTVTSSGAFTPVPQSGALALSVRASQLAGTRRQVHPAATPLGTTVTVESLLGGRRHGRHSSAPTLGRIAGPATGDDLDVSLTFGDPFPATWDDLVVVELAEGVAVRAPGATRSATVAAFFTAVLPLEELGATFEPGLGPPLEPRIEEQDAHGSTLQLLLRVGPTPTLSWSAPGLGTATGYSVAIIRVAERDADTELVPVARLFTGARSVRLPPGILEPGTTYLAIITAHDDPTRDMGRAPFRLSAPSSSAELVTSPFTP